MQLEQLKRNCLALWRSQGMTARLFHQITQVSGWQDWFGTPPPPPYEKWLRFFQCPNWRGVDFDFIWAHKNKQHRLIFWFEASYPDWLFAVPDPPPVLFVMGQAAALSLPMLAIVGSRKASTSAVMLSL